MSNTAENINNGISILDYDIDEQDLPIPLGWQVLVQPIRIEEKTKGGIILPEQEKQAQEYLRYIGKVVAMGHLCYQSEQFQKAGPWCRIGNWIAHGQYAGQEIIVRTKDGGRAKLRLLNDDEVKAIIPNPQAVLTRN